MKSSSVFAAMLLLVLLASPAWAHFVWVAVLADSAGKPAVHVWFSELAEPDSADLIDKIATVKVWSRDAGGKSQPITVAKQVKDGGGALVGAIAMGTENVSAHIQYGVITRGEQTFLLQYWAKYLDIGQSDWKTFARDPELKLDVVPHPKNAGFALEVLFDGKPAPGAEFVIFDPNAKETTAKADEAGKLTLASMKPGVYSIRAKWVVAGKGKLGDDEYSQVNHYSTLTLRVAETMTRK